MDRRSGPASVLAAQGQDLPAVAAVMVAFGLGVGVPILLVASLSREALRRWRGRMIAPGRAENICSAAPRWRSRR